MNITKLHQKRANAMTAMETLIKKSLIFLLKLRMTLFCQDLPEKVMEDRIFKILLIVFIGVNLKDRDLSLM